MAPLWLGGICKIVLHNMSCNTQLTSAKLENLDEQSQVRASTNNVL